jgi:hypothetical protein
MNPDRFYVFVPQGGLEPPTPGFKDQCSNQLNYCGSLWVRRDSNSRCVRVRTGCNPVLLLTLGTPGGSRTHNRPIKSRLLYLLSYRGKALWVRQESNLLARRPLVYSQLFRHGTSHPELGLRREYRSLRMCPPETKKAALGFPGAASDLDVFRLVTWS